MTRNKAIALPLLFICGLYFWLGFLLKDVLEIEVLAIVPMVVVCIIFAMVTTGSYTVRIQNNEMFQAEGIVLFIFLFFVAFTFVATQSLVTALMIGWIISSSLVLLVLQAVAIAELYHHFSRTKLFLLFSTLAIFNLIVGILFNQLLLTQLSFSLTNLI